MTPTLGWIMTAVALAAIVTTVVLMRRLGRQPMLPEAQGTVQVIVDSCDHQNFSIRVVPWKVWLRRGRPLEWNFAGPPGSTLTVVPEKPQEWPFEDSPKPPKAPPGRVRTGNSKSSARGAHKYSLKIECEGRTYDIDPDIYFFY